MHIEWEREDGSIKAFAASFDITPSPSGSVMHLKQQMRPPFAPPAFLLKRGVRNNLVETATALRQHLSAH